MRLAQPQVLIDINRIVELDYMTERIQNSTPGVSFGALTRQRSIENADGVLARLPLLQEAIRWVGHPQIRNRGTIGGSIAHADPAAELPLVFRALDGVALVQSRHGSRTIAASDFFLYAMTPALEPDELIVEIWLPLPAPRTGQAFLEVARRHGDFALVAVAASLTLDERYRCSDVRIAVGGAAPVPMRATGAEDALRGERARIETFKEAARVAAREMEPTSDIHGDAAYRRDVTEALTSRALETAFKRVKPNGAETTIPDGRVPGGER
jgi:CO/xanthine dehydrogenase FAD-binding subunit